MGLKTTNYKVEELGITLAEAYAQLEHMSVDLEGESNALFKIQTSRSSMDKPAIDTKYFSCTINKDEPIYEQVYTKAKEDGLFDGWEDDIITE